MPELEMPKMGDAMEEGTILRWLKSEGDRIEEEEEVAEIQTEKATIVIPSTERGVLTKILVSEGQTVPVGTPIAVVGAPGEARKADGAAPGGTAGATKAVGAEAPAPPEPAAEVEKNPAPPPPAGPQPGERVKASPLARKLAAEHSLDLARIEGTGPGGRIIEADVEEALRRPGGVPAAPYAPPAAAPGPAPSLNGGERPMSPMRKVIARRLTQSKQTIPHFYLTTDVDMRAAAKLRGEYNAAAGEERKVSFNDLVVRACATALVRHPKVASQLDGEVIRTPATINIGVAVALDEGLVVPVIRDAHAKSVSAIGAEMRALAERARKGGLKPDEFSGGVFSISNLGMYDVVQFQAVINPPEAAIMAVGAIRDTPIVENGQVVPGKQMFLTISVDHRIVDGHVAALFLQEVKRLLETPLGLFS